MIADFMFEMLYTVGVTLISFFAGAAWLMNNLRKKGLVRWDNGEGIYHEPSSCNRCGGCNEIKIKDSIDHIMCEAETTCQSCGFEDYWSYGFFQSSDAGYNFCRKYGGK